MKTKLLSYIHSNDIFKVLKIRPFYLLMLSEFFSQLAFNMQHFVLIFILFRITHSNVSVSALILSFTIPAVLFSLISGAYVDRWDKKRVLFLTNLIRGFLLLPFIFSGLGRSFIYVLTFAIAVATQFFIPAESAIIPTLVPKKLFVSANTIFSLGIYGTMLLGYVLSGPMLLFVGRQNSIIILAALFFLGTFFVSIMGKSKRPEDTRKVPGIGDLERSLQREIKEVLSFIKSTKKILYALFILTLSQSVLFMFAVLGPGFMTDILKVRAESLSIIILAPAAAGIVVGGLIIGSFGKKLNFKTLTFLGFLASGVVFSILPLVDNLSNSSAVASFNNLHLFHIGIIQMAVVLAAIAGLANAMIFIPGNVIIQTNTSEEMRGRVYGFLNALTGAVSLLPVVLAGGLADLFGVSHVIIIVGIIMIVFGIILNFLD